MRRLSSAIKPAGYRTLVAATLACIVATCVVFRHAHVPGETWFWLAVPFVIFATRYRGLWSRLADEVRVDGAQLLVHQGNRWTQLVLCGIEVIDQPLGSSLVTLKLRAPCPLGDQIRFIAPTPKRWGDESIAAELGRYVRLAGQAPS